MSIPAWIVHTVGYAAGLDEVHWPRLLGLDGRLERRAGHLGRVDRRLPRLFAVPFAVGGEPYTAMVDGEYQTPKIG